MSTEQKIDERRPFERVTDIPLILEAMRQGVREALLRHVQNGTPVAVWRDDKVVWVKAEDIVIE